MTSYLISGRHSNFRERVRQEREQEILEAARDVFAERGFEKASIDDIAERVGIGKGTVYLHFASKEELLLALMRQACQRVVETCRSRMGTQPTASAKLKAIISTLVEHRFANQRWVQVVLTELPTFLGYKQRFGASNDLRGLITAVLEEAQAEGWLDPRVRPPMAALALLFLIFVSPSAISEHLSKQELIDATTHMYFFGISREPAHDHAP